MPPKRTIPAFTPQPQGSHQNVSLAQDMQYLHVAVGNHGAPTPALAFLAGAVLGRKAGFTHATLDPSLDFG